MRAGTLDERLTLQREESTDVGGGVSERTWGDVATVWAAVEELEGSEYYQAQQTQARETHRVQVRRPLPAGVEITTEHRFVDDQGTALNITRVKGRQRDRHYEVMCTAKA